MEDLIVNFIGAVVFSVIGFIYVRNRGKGVSVISRFVPRRKSHDRDYLRLAGGDGDVSLAPGAQAHQRNASPSTIHTTTITHDADLSAAGENGSTCNPMMTSSAAMASTMFAVFGLPVLRSMDANLLAGSPALATGRIVRSSTRSQADRHRAQDHLGIPGQRHVRVPQRIDPHPLQLRVRSPRWPSSSRGAVSTGGGRSCWSAVSPAACWSSR